MSSSRTSSTANASSEPTASIGLISFMRMPPKNGMILSAMMYSLVIQVCSLILGLISAAYTSTKSLNVMSKVPRWLDLKSFSHSSASSSVSKPLFTSCFLVPLPSR